VFMECEEGRLHQNCDFCRVDLEPVPGLRQQGTGRILATTFENRWFPLLRFEIGDLARLSSGPCPCGRTFGLTLSSIEGRLISAFLAPGRGIVTHGQMDRAIAEADGLEDYRIDQESPGRARLRVIISEDQPAQAALRQARDSLRALLGDKVEIDAEAVSCLLPESSGKFLLAKRHFPLNSSGGEDGR